MTEWVRVASVSEVREGEPFPARVRDIDIGLYRVGEHIYALDDTCPHEFAQLTQGFVEGSVIECPLHQARFEITTGALLDGPAASGVRTFAVKIEGQDVLVAAPDS
jgi:3-phenylpropionate/trans-cinnamate dioxygenase ferredoxin subunit